MKAGIPHAGRQTPAKVKGNSKARSTTPKKKGETAANPKTKRRSGSKAPTPWERPDPKPPSARAKLRPADRKRAKARADAAGRRYPNLVDNMWAARTKG